MRIAAPAVLMLALAGAALAAAGPQPAFAQMSASDLVVRLEQLENHVRQLTGTIEQLQYRNQQLEQQLQRMQADSGGAAAAPAGANPVAPPGMRPVLQNRPTALPPQQAAPVAPPPVAPGRRSDVFDPSQNPNAPGAPRVLGNVAVVAPPEAPVTSEAPPIGAPGGRGAGAPLDLSTLAGGNDQSGLPSGGLAPQTQGPLPPPPSRNPNATGAVASVAPPTQTPRDLFDLGSGSIQRKDYALAEDAFRDFLKRYPNDRMAADAQYWLAESLFQRQRYRDAAEIFLAMSTKHETAGKAPDALLRLGQSLAALGEKETACATLGEVGRKYPRASVSVKQGVEREQKRVRC